MLCYSLQKGKFQGYKTPLQNKVFFFFLNPSFFNESLWQTRSVTGHGWLLLHWWPMELNRSPNFHNHCLKGTTMQVHLEWRNDSYCFGSSSNRFIVSFAEIDCRHHYLMDARWRWGDTHPEYPSPLSALIFFSSHSTGGLVSALLPHPQLQQALFSSRSPDLSAEAPSDRQKDTMFVC